MTEDTHAHWVRNELSSLALLVHKLANAAGGDLGEAFAALDRMEGAVTQARTGLRGLPPLGSA